MAVLEPDVVALESLVSESRLTTEQKNEFQTALLIRMRFAKEFWKPLHTRQDYWATMYRLLDPIQQLKPIGVARRFTSSDPRTGPDAALSILTRNEPRWRIDFITSEDENNEERRKIGKIERTLQGVIHDLDDMFTARGQMPFWKQVGFQGLIRGWCWGKIHVTAEALKYREAPFIAEIYDARTCYPQFDSFGLNHIIIEKLTSLGDLVMMYPDIYGEKERSKSYDPNTPAVKLEFWSNTRGERAGVTGTLALIGSPPATHGRTYDLYAEFDPKDSQWVIEPFFHGYTPDQLPVIGAPFNGAHFFAMPEILGTMESRLSERPDALAMQALDWQGPQSWVAESGRSILSAVEEQVPQYNELIATIFQHLSIETYGTWVFKTPTGQLPDFEAGIESKIALTPQESVEHITPSPISPDAYRLVDLLQNERQKGVLSNILQATTPFQGTGVLFQQIANAALNALAPYEDGMKRFGQRAATSVLAQLQAAGGAIKKFEVVAPAAKHSFFRIEFDPKNDLDKKRHYRPVPIMKPDIPDDLTVRMTAARMALDPRRPLLSLQNVLENILQVDDPSGEIDRIWEDLAQTDPIIILEQMAQALERMGEVEMSARIRENEFKAALIEDLQFRQATGNIPGLRGGGGGQEQGTGALPPPEAGPNQASTARTGVAGPAQPEGFEAAGVQGERFFS